MLEMDGARVYTRSGSFRWDESGNLAAPGGFLVPGRMAEPDGTIATQTAVSSINLSLAGDRAGRDVGGGDRRQPVGRLRIGDAHTTSIVTYESIGEAHELLVDFTKTGANTGDVVASMDGSALTLSSASLTFDTDGNLTSAGTISLSGYTPPGAGAIAIDVELNGTGPLVQYGGSVTAEGFDQNGNAIGFLNNFAIAENGTITGQFSNGETKVLAMIATATFNNPSGLIRDGDTHFTSSVNSGEPIIGEPGTGNRSLIAAGALEMSNVDLALEFTNLIIAQRGFQANGRVITATDEILADLVNLKR
jgi:flagellar hook protein FlgE